MLFSVREPNALQSQALADILNQARKIAEVAASRTGVSLGELRTFRVNCAGWNMETTSPLVPAGPASPSPKEVELKMTVDVTFNYG